MADNGAMKVRVYPTVALSIALGALAAIARPGGEPARGQRPADTPPTSVLTPVSVEAQPLAANIQRVVEALQYLGAPLPADLRGDLSRAGQARDAKTLQERMDARVLLAVHINPEARVKVVRDPHRRSCSRPAIPRSS
jgi:hypothetical protein